MSWLYTNPKISHATRSGISTYGLGLNHGYDTLFRPYFSTYYPEAYRNSVYDHFRSNPSYHLLGEFESYPYYNPPPQRSSHFRFDDPNIDSLESEMNNFISNINNPHNAYNSYDRRFYPYMMSQLTLDERLAELGIGSSASGTFEDNRRTPKPVDYEMLVGSSTDINSARPSNMTHLNQVSAGPNQDNDPNTQIRNQRASIIPPSQPQNQRQSIVPGQQQQQQQQNQRQSIAPSQQQQQNQRQSIVQGQNLQRQSIVPNQQRSNPPKPKPKPK